MCADRCFACRYSAGAGRLNVHFYRSDCGRREIAARIPPIATFRCWSPGVDGLPSRGSRRPANYFWWALARVGGFAQPAFAEICVEERRRIVHRLIVTPRWYRFPFMGGSDLQIGEVWTSPVARRRQLARAAIAEAHRRFGFSGSAIWYVTDSDNVASSALARSCGYRLVAVGRRTRPLGLALFGRYVIDRFLQCEETDTQEIAPACSDESAAGRSLSVSH